MKKIIITGASGFLGLAVVRELAASGKYDIYAVTTGRRTVAFPDGVQPVKADLLDRVQTHKIVNEIKPDTLLHLAWELSEPSYLNADSNIRWLEESLFMLRTFIEAGGQHFAFAGSSAEYERFSGFSEGEQKSGTSLYGQGKSNFHYTAVKYCADHNARYINLRYFPILGKGMRANTAAAAAAAAAFFHGEHFTCRSPYNIWDFIDIEDAAKATRAVLESEYNGAINIGSGIPRVMGDVFTAIARKMNSEHLLSLDYDNASCEILVANTDLLNNLIGFRCTGNFKETLDDLIAAVREREKTNAD